MRRDATRRFPGGLRALPGIASILFFCVAIAPPAAAVNTVSGALSGNTIWTASPDPIWFIDSSVTVMLADTLTIEPGVTVKFDQYQSLYVDGTLLAAGGTTVDSTIYFTSMRDDNLPPGGDDTNGDGNATIPGNSDWASIQARSATSVVDLFHCELWFGGYSSTGVVVSNGGGDAFLDNCAIKAGHYGAVCSNGSLLSLTNSDVSACTDVPVAWTIESILVLSASTFASTSDNGFDALGVLPSTLTSGTSTLPSLDISIGGAPVAPLTLLLLGDITVAAGAILNVSPGAVIKVPSPSTDVIVYGRLAANADGDSTIIFTSFKDDSYGNPADTNNDGSSTAPAPGDWGGLVFETGSSGTILNCVIKYGGTGPYGANVRMTNTGTDVNLAFCEVSDATTGIEIAGVSNPNLAGNTIANCTQVPIRMSVSANPNFMSGTNFFSNNGITALGLIPETIAVNSQIFSRSVAGYDNITYYLDGLLVVDVGAHLIVDPAVVLKFGYVWGNSGIEVRGSMAAIGTAAPDSQCIFTSFMDDTHGNPADTNGDGSATAPAHSDWDRITFASTSVDAACRLEHCFLGYGGYRPWDVHRAVVFCENSSPTLVNNEFWINKNGIRCEGTSAAIVTDNSFFGSAELPIMLSVTATPTIQDNSYDQNGFHALGLLPETLSANATLSLGLAGVGNPGQAGKPFPYFFLFGPVTVGSGSVLTIDPGVVFKTDGSTFIVDGGLIAEDVSGTNPIIFTDIKDDSHGGDSNVDGNATIPGTSDWTNLYFGDTSDDPNCRLEGVEFWYGGAGGAVVTMDNAGPSITNCAFEFNNTGIRIQGPSSPTVTGNLIRQSASTPISLDILATPTLSGNSFDSNRLTALGIHGGALAQNATLPVRDVAGYTNITYVLEGNLSVQFGATLTVEPGVVLKMWDAWNQGTYGTGSVVSVSGALIAAGTAPLPIVFTSVEDDGYGNPLDTNVDGSLTEPAPGEWDYIDFADVSDDVTSILDHVIVRYGGSWRSKSTLVDVDSASPTITNSTFEYSAAHGLTCRGVSDPTVSGNTFSNNTLCPVTISLQSNPVFTGNASSGNAYDAIGVIGETLASDVIWARRAFAGDDNREYVLLSDMTVGTSSNLTLEKGLVIKPLPGVDLRVKRGLFAQGGSEPESLIVFTSVSDDYYGGDTNGDGPTTDGSANRWGGIVIEPEALSSNVIFENCVFSWGPWNGALGAVTVQGSLSPDFTGCLLSNNYIALDYQQASGDPVLGGMLGCDFFGNASYAVRNTGLAHTVSAYNCWWGDGTGPTHASNPGGLGDPITDMVDYTPWVGGGVVSYHVGDVSENNEIHAYDGSLILQYLVAAITLTWDQLVIADVDCDASVLALDASQILQYVTNLIVTFPCHEVAEPVRDSFQVPDAAEERGNIMASGDHSSPQLAPSPPTWRATLQNVPLGPGERVHVPLIVQGTGELLAAQFTMRPDAGAIRIVGVTAGPAAQDALFATHVDDEGVARVALASALPLEPGTVAMLEVEILADPAPAGELVIEFVDAFVNADDVRDASVGSRGLLESAPTLPSTFGLAQNRPNPFRPNTAIHFQVPALAAGSTPVDLAVFGVDGRRVRTLASGSHVPGEYEKRWDGRDEYGTRVAAGVYFYRLRAGSFIEQKKMILLK